MKIFPDKYPIGIIGNRTPGRYVDETFYENLRILAKSIVRDMTFLGFVFSSTLEVGTGKTVFVSQVGEMWTDLMKQEHNIDVPFDIKNCVFTPEKLIEQSFKVPKYSFIWLDEWEDAHYWSKLGMTLRQFFRKCRQLNLFMVCVIPDFFQCPMSYAVSRSVFAVDVKFEGEFERGYFNFYNFERKAELYIKGKKEHNYKVVRANFSGRFLDGYAINEKEYRAAKYQDMIDSEHDAKPLDELQVKAKFAKQMKENLPSLTMKQLSVAAGVSEATVYAWFKKERRRKEEGKKKERETIVVPNCV